MKYLKRFNESYQLNTQNLISGKDFTNKYVSFSNGKLHKVLYKKNLKLGSNLGDGEYWCVTPDSLDVYLGNTRDSSEYQKFVKEVISKKLPKTLEIYVEEGIVDEIDDDKKILKQIRKIADGLYDPEYGDYGLVLFNKLK